MHIFLFFFSLFCQSSYRASIGRIFGCCGCICNCTDSNTIIILTNFHTVECQRHRYSVVITQFSSNMHLLIIVKNKVFFCFIKFGFALFNCYCFLSIKSIVINTRRTLCTSINRSTYLS
jgi:hypothetical protein